VNLQTLTERHVITFRKPLINLLYQPTWTILVKLGEIDMTPLIILSNTQSCITWYNLSFINYKYMIKFVSDLQLVVFSEYSVLLHQTKLTATKILLKMPLYTITTTFPSTMTWIKLYILTTDCLI
jgi:hypothetical protein